MYAGIFSPAFFLLLMNMVPPVMATMRTTTQATGMAILGSMLGPCELEPGSVPRPPLADAGAGIGAMFWTVLILRMMGGQISCAWFTLFLVNGREGGMEVEIVLLLSSLKIGTGCLCIFESGALYTACSARSEALLRVLVFRCYSLRGRNPDWLRPPITDGCCASRTCPCLLRRRRSFMSPTMALPEAGK